MAAWAEVSGGTAGYRMATVTRANIGTTLTVVGNVEPVSDAAPSFQVAGKVATVNVTPGAQVTAGETLGTLDTTALSETVSSAQSTLNSDEAKLAEDEANESASVVLVLEPKQRQHVNDVPVEHDHDDCARGSGGTPSGGGQSATVTADQNKLTQDQSTLSLAQQQEAADLAQAQSDCTSANTSTPTGQAACETALQTVSADEQLVSKDQATVSKDEASLAQALTAESSSSSGTTGNSGSSPTADAVSSDPNATGNTGSGGTGSTASNNRGASSSTGSSSTSTNTDTPEQIASDQAAIDTAEANLTEAAQSLKEATLTSPINGTAVSVGITVGDTVSAGSSTAIITIVGTKSYEAQATLDSAQIPTVKVGQKATAQVDGVDGTIEGTVSQVGPVQSTSSGFTYPVVVALPDSVAGLYAGSTANLDVSTGSVANVLAVPTSAVQTVGSSSYVTEIENGQLTRKVIKIGMVGDVYTQVDSGLSAGQSVVLVDYAEPVPSSNTNATGGLGGFLGGGAGGFPGGGGAFNFQRVGTGGGTGLKVGG